MRSLMTARDELAKESHFIEVEIAKHKSLVDSMHIPEEKVTDDYKRLSVEYEKLYKMLQIKHKSDRSVLKTKIDMLEAGESRNLEVHNRIKEATKNQKELIWQGLSYLEKIKSVQNHRMNIMMQIIESNVNRLPQKPLAQLSKGAAAPGRPREIIPKTETNSETRVRQYRRESSVGSEMLDYYSPEVRQYILAEKLISSNDKGQAISEEHTHEMNYSPAIGGLESPGDDDSMERELNGKVEDGFEDIDSEDRTVKQTRKGVSNGYPVKGEDYLKTNLKK